MHRFTFQLVPGVVPISPVVVGGITHDTPVWRCSGCLVQRGVYEPLTERGRPAGSQGCMQCHRRPVTALFWFPDNMAAREVDKECGMDPSPILAVNRLALVAMAVVEGTIIGGNWNRLTPSCEAPLTEALTRTVHEELRPLVVRSGMRIKDWGIEFDRVTHVVSVHIVLRCKDAFPPEVGEEHFTVRFRWLQ